METSTLFGLLLFLGVWGFSILRREVKEPRYKTTLIVNIDSLEKEDQYDLPKERIQMRKTLLLCAPLAPGMRVEELGLSDPVKVVETIVTEELIAVYLEPIRVPSSAMESERIGLEKFEWKIYDLL